MTIMRNRHTSVWSKAAELIAEGKCRVIVPALEGTGYKVYPHPADIFSFYFEDWFGRVTPENQLARTLALLLMEQIEGDDHGTK